MAFCAIAATPSKFRCNRCTGLLALKPCVSTNRQPPPRTIAEGLFCIMRLQEWRGSRFLSWVWTVTIAVLCFLPGSALPQEDWLDAVAFDKWVHLGLFAGLLFLWRFQFSNAPVWGLLAAAVVYAFGIEAVQHYFIPNRSFDVGDVMADVGGAGLGLGAWAWFVQKNRPL